MFDFSIVTNWIHQMLTSLMPEGLAVFLECVVIGVCIILMYAVLAIILIYMERKICAFFQCRLGPMRVGKWGLLQVPCDVIKMLTKEIIDLKFSDRFLYNLAPFMVIIASFLTFACLPVSKGLEVLDFNVGVFFLLAASSIGVVGILLAGWSSNNKFSLIEAMRSGAQISYELSCGLSILTMVVLMGTMQILRNRSRTSRRLVHLQRTYPGSDSFHHLPDCRQCGNQPRSVRLARSRKRADGRLSYGILRYRLRLLLPGRVPEPVHRSDCVAATIFLGGWMPLHIVGLDGFNAVMDYIPGFVWFFGKAFFVVFLLMWIKWTFPRLRIDQILNLEWKYLVPISMVNLILMVLIVVFELHF